MFFHFDEGNKIRFLYLLGTLVHKFQFRSQPSIHGLQSNIQKNFSLNQLSGQIHWNQVLSLTKFSIERPI